MRIAVTHVYSSKNRGDAAILLCQLEELRRVFPGAQFEIMTLSRSAEEQDFEGIPVRRSLMSTVVGGGAPRPIRPFLGVAMMALTTGWCSIKRTLGVKLPLPSVWRQPLVALDQCDAQVCVGGGYLRGREHPHSTYQLALLVHQILMGHLLGKPVYLYAQSFGPFPGRGQKALFRAATKWVSLALPRESISREVVESTGMRRTAVNQVIDTAFLVRTPARRSLAGFFGGSIPPVVVGITARQWLSADGQAAYEQSLVALSRHILAKGWGVLVIPQVTASEHGDDDREVGRRLAAHMKGERNFACVEDELSISNVLEIYGSLDYLVGTRFHSVIFCLCMGIPCLAIEYEHKTSGILRDLGLGKWCLNISSMSTEELVRLFEELVDDRDSVLAVINKTLPVAQATARRGADLIAQHFNGTFANSAAE